jgi:S1-C subfamily serine protease
MRLLFSTSRYILAVILLLYPLAVAAEGGWLGVTVQNVNPQTAFGLGLGTPRGVMVTMVRQGGPAARAGLMQGDVIIEFNGQSIDDVAELRRLARKSAPGSSVRLKVIRKRRELTIPVVVGQEPRDSA